MDAVVRVVDFMKLRSALFALSLCAFGQIAQATPEFVEHLPNAAVFGEPVGTRMLDPIVPRESQPTTIFSRIGYSFFYNEVAIYFTTDGSTPGGTKGSPSGNSQVLRSNASQVTFVRNEATGSGQVDIWKAILPSSTRSYGQQIRYVISAWHSAGGPEVFSNTYGCSDGSCDTGATTTFSFTNKIAWPGKGAPAADHTIGYPPVSFWKEEAVAGNNYINTMLDQNGSIYDVYYPSAGCVRGMGTRNEGYVGGNDTFPPGLPTGNRGQMNINQAMPGLRVGGKTYWLSNEAGSGYHTVTQRYLPGTNVIESKATLSVAPIQVTQFDFAPAGITFPTDLGNEPNRGIHVKRMVLLNTGSTAQSLNLYFYKDVALNGGDNFDQMSFDPVRGAMIASDTTQRNTSSSGEYNPTSFGDYTKNVSVYLASSIKVCAAVGSPAGTIAKENWRDTSSDNGQGWIGTTLTLQPGIAQEVDILVAGGFDNFPFATGTYSYQIAPVIDWFTTSSMAATQASTEAHWQNWLSQGTTIETPDSAANDLFKRGLLGTALHLDGKNGGVVAGMHNGAYPFVWPRDAAYAAVTLSRTGHFSDAENVYRFLRDIAFRANDAWGKGFFYQKYTTDGHIVWSAPQVDETAVVPWGIKAHYDTTGSIPFLNSYYGMVYESARASSEDSSIDSRLFYDDPNLLMNSMNVWEDSFDDFIYSNANIVRGMSDAATIASTLGHSADAALFTARANTIRNGVNGRLDWNGENMDISQLGIIYPFQIMSPVDPRANRVINRVNGVVGNNSGALQPLVNTSGDWAGLVNRYWGDSYWNGGPWYLTTLWYGLFHMERADAAPGHTDIDLHLNKLNLLINRLTPIGFGAEQIAPNTSLLYPGQTDFSHQAAWPNAWESMSTFVDAYMAFLDMTPDAPANTLRIAPKLPTAWPQMTFRNVKLGAHRFDISASREKSTVSTKIVNLTGQAASFDVYLKIPSGFRPELAYVNGVRTTFTLDLAANRVRIQGVVPPTAGGQALIQVRISSTRRGPVG